MQKLTANPSLLQTLRQSVLRTVSAAERSDQRVSLIMGSLDDKSAVERKEVEEYVAREMGTAAHAR